MEFLEDSLLPEFKGSTFRGATGWHLKKAAANLNPVYENIFETEGGDNNPEFLIGVKKIPHPFILNPPLTEKRLFKCGEIITVGITLFGYAHNFLPFFVQAYTTMGQEGITSKKHKLKLLNVYNEDASGAKFLVYEAGSAKIRNNYNPIILDNILAQINYSSKKVSLEFDTPFLLQNKSVEIDERNIHLITPSLLVASIERRYKSLAQYFCRSASEIKELFKPAEDVVVSKLDLKNFTLHRYSNRIKKDQFYEGLIGSIELQGNLKSILPILYIGEKINIGKKTSFGWGQYKIVIHD
jgi:hypothetical protein